MDVVSQIEQDAAIVAKDIVTLGEEALTLIKGGIADIKTGGLLTVLAPVAQFIKEAEAVLAGVKLATPVAGELGDVSQDILDFNAGKPVGIQVNIPVVNKAVTVVIQRGSMVSPVPNVGSGADRA